MFRLIHQSVHPSPPFFTLSQVSSTFDSFFTRSPYFPHFPFSYTILGFPSYRMKVGKGVRDDEAKAESMKAERGQSRWE